MRAIDFESSTCFVTLRPASYLRPYIIDFLNIITPTLTAASVREAMRTTRRRMATDA